MTPPRPVRAVSGGAAVVVLGAALAGCTAGGWSDLPAPGTPWTLADVYGGGWDRALVACPYETPETFSTVHGLPYPGPDLTSRDDVQVVVLLDGDQVVEQDVLARDDVDLCATDLGELTPDDPLVVDASLAPERAVRPA
ncbi:hypothetical protein [Quadrisphaera sp. INWT6]|uniref:hypothetical protein n=1 Tax=Quadrisphaera sp. INWT6 TaxID=2596917 RepID=UPI001892639D|nr:hypothetical protein [Quadrisphaera sp. INWT6]